MGTEGAVREGGAVSVGHTPGPWEWASNVFTGERARDRECIRFMVGADGQGFAHTVGLSPERDSANADLIAAAPDLLAALEGMIAAGGGFQCGCTVRERLSGHRIGCEWPALSTAADIGRAAIAKARGQTNDAPTLEQHQS